MFLANLSPREKGLFYLTIAIILLSLIYNFGFKPLSEKWSQLNYRILNKEIELKKNIKYIRQKEEVKKIYLNYAQYMQRPGVDEMAAFLNAVEKEANAAQIHIANIRPRPIKDFPFYKKYILETDCEASLEKLVAFIYNLQTSRQLIRVENLKLTSQGKVNPLLKAQMLITKVVPAE